jgi:hypothetical protein
VHAFVRLWGGWRLITQREGPSQYEPGVHNERGSPTSSQLPLLAAPVAALANLKHSSSLAPFVFSSF